MSSWCDGGRCETIAKRCSTVVMTGSWLRLEQQKKK